MTHSSETPRTPEDDIDPDAEIGTAANAIIDTLTQNQQEAMAATETTGTAVLAGLTKVQREVADFVSERLRQDIETQKDLIRCKSFGELREVQTRFFRTAVTQYSTEANRLVRLGAETMAKSMERGA